MERNQGVRLEKGSAMKRPWSRVIGVGGLALTLAGFVQGFPRDTTTALAAWGKKKQQVTTPEPAPAAPTTPPAVPGVGSGEHVVHTFEDESKFQEFKQLWEQRQAILVRMTVLKAYWDNEQVVLTTLNDTLAKEYHLDVAKNYVLDTKRNVLIEREAPAEPSQPAAPSEPPTSAVAPSTP